MRKLVVMVAVAALVLTCSTAFARSLGLPNELINGGFELGNLTGWTVVNQPSGGSWDFPGADKEGTKMARFVRGYNSGQYPNASLNQDVYVDPGWYIIDLSGWVKRYCLNSSFGLQPTWGWVKVVLTVDDNPIWESPQYAANDQWNYVEYVTPAPVYVNEKKDVHIVWGVTGNNYMTFDVLLADGFDLEEVPEPCSMMVLFSGLGALVLRRRK